MHGMRTQEFLLMHARSGLCDQLTCKLNNLTELVAINRLLLVFHLLYDKYSCRPFHNILLFRKSD